MVTVQPSEVPSNEIRPTNVDFQMTLARDRSDRGPSVPRQAPSASVLGPLGPVVSFALAAGVVERPLSTRS